MAPKQDPAEYVASQAPIIPSSPPLYRETSSHIALIHDSDMTILHSSAKTDVALLCNILMSVPELKLDNKSLATILGLSSPKNV